MFHGLLALVGIFQIFYQKQFNRESKYETYTVYLKFKIQGPDGFELSWEQ